MLKVIRFATHVGIVMPETTDRDPASIEVSAVIPCLNEAATIGTCVEKAQRAFREHNIRGEVVVADNGSTDGSIELAMERGARVVHVPYRGYGNALRHGIEASHGKYIIMGDADDSYDFHDLPRFVELLRTGVDLAQGCRLRSGGGTIEPGAMPFLHRWVGNPLLTRLARTMFDVPIRDIYCGMRGFTRDLYDRLNLRCSGMEFATEMIVKAVAHHAKIGELPITLHPDGRQGKPPHLRTFRDGWRTLRFFLMYCPRWLFLIPGLLLMLLGVVGYALVLPSIPLGGIHIDVHTLLVASLALLLGYQSVLFGIFSKAIVIRDGLMPEDRRLTRFFEVVGLERCLLLGAGTMLVGLVLIAGIALQWGTADFGPLNYACTMRRVIPGVMLCALGFQTMLASFMVSILGLGRR